jgi:hypothetical protein
MIFNSRHKLAAAVFTNIECDPLDIALKPLLELAPVFDRLEEESRVRAVKDSVPALSKYVGTYRMKDDGGSRPPCDEVVFRVASWRSSGPFIGGGTSGTNLNMRVPKLGSPEFRINQGEGAFLEPWRDQTFRIKSGVFESDFLHFVEGAKGEIVGFRWRTYNFEKANPK